MELHLCAKKFIPHLTTKCLYMYDHVPVCVATTVQIYKLRREAQFI